MSDIELNGGESIPMPVEKAKHIPIVPIKMLVPFLLLTSCFAWWGLSNNMTDPLVKAFPTIFSDMSNLQSAFIQFAFYGAYFCLALPGAIIIRKYSYKHGVLIGLGMYIVGGLLFFPAKQLHVFEFFLVAYYVLAGGLSILETSANPYIISLGPPETATQRLNLAQSFNPVGSVVGILFARNFILSRLESLDTTSLGEEAVQSAQLSIVVNPYLGVALFLILIWILLAVIKMPNEKAADGEHDALAPTFRRLMKNPHYVFAIVAQFFYMCTQISVWTFTNYYIPEQLGIPASEALHYHMWAIILFGFTRFTCTSLMSYIKPQVLLFWAAVIGVLLSLVVVFVGGMLGVFALILISACMSLMFPTIYGLGVSDLGKDTKLGGSILIMAILGGALMPLLQARVIDISSARLSYLVPMMSFFVIAAFAIFSLIKKGGLHHRGGNRKIRHHLLTSFFLLCEVVLVGALFLFN